MKRPAKCGVLDKNLIDDLLRTTYRSLGKLPGFVVWCLRTVNCIFTFVWLNSGYQNQGWRGALEPKTMVLLSLIKRQYPDADIEQVFPWSSVLNLILNIFFWNQILQKVDHFFDPSRVECDQPQSCRLWGFEDGQDSPQKQQPVGVYRRSKGACSLRLLWHGRWWLDTDCLRFFAHKVVERCYAPAGVRTEGGQPLYPVGCSRYPFANWQQRLVVHNPVWCNRRPGRSRSIIFVLSRLVISPCSILTFW